MRGTPDSRVRWSDAWESRVILKPSSLVSKEKRWLPLALFGLR